MADDVDSNVWPNDLVQTFWNLENFGKVEKDELAFSGVSTSQEFLVAFAAGVVLITLFAWDRFNRRSFDPQSFDYRVLKELAPADLRSRDVVLRAYGIYAFCMVMIYTIFSFFGELIANTLAALNLNIAGPLSAEGFIFTDFTWPLIVGLAIVGAGPVLPPIQMFEQRLRKFSHSAAGIPVRIHDYTRNLKILLREDFAEEPATTYTPPPWVNTLLGTENEEVQETYRSRDQLKLLLKWLTFRTDDWPSTEIRRRLAGLDHDLIEEARVALQDFDELLERDYNTAPKTVGLDSNLPAKERLVLHRRRMEEHWRQYSTRLDALRDELAALLVIYVERDQAYDRIGVEELRDVIQKSLQRPHIQEGPHYWLSVSLIAVFLIYVVAIYFDALELLGTVSFSFFNIALTALIETAKVAALFLVPVAAAGSIRYFKRERNTWDVIAIKSMTRPMMTQLLLATSLGIAAAIAASQFVYMFHAAALAKNSEHFKDLFARGDYAFWAIALSLVGMSAIQVVMVLLAIDAKRSKREIRRWPQIPYGIVSAALVIACYLTVVYLWRGGFRCGLGELVSSASSIEDRLGCARQLDLVNVTVYGLTAFLSATFFIPRDEDVYRKWRRKKPGARKPPATSQAGVTAGALGIALLLWGLGAGPAPAQDAAGKPDEIHAGFRADAVPFSYRVKGANEERYAGYIADLCYEIFKGARYTIVPHQVAASERFERLKTNIPDAGTPMLPEESSPTQPKRDLDILCDPTTLRYSAGDDRGKVGIFSPIVFASGISYITRHSRILGDIRLAFVGKTTAKKVALNACENRIFSKEDERHLPCRPTEINKCVLSTGDRKKVTPDTGNEAASRDEGMGNGQVEPSETAEARYILCRFPSHDDLITWFCAREERLFKVYFGDRDIIRAKLEEYQRTGKCSNTEIISETFTYEPYALLITDTDTELVRFVQRRVYEIFSDRDLATSLFRRNFPGKRMSHALGSVFLINGVENPQGLRPVIGGNN